MKEIKFRAWDKRFNKMDFGSGALLLRINNTDFSEPMQFTGLHDKNGKEIYEGDILHWYTIYAKENRVVNDYKLAVYFDEECPGYYVKINKITERLFQSRMKYFEVIGNIYENPELLK